MVVTCYRFNRWVFQKELWQTPAYRNDRGQNKKELWKSSKANLKAHEKEKDVVGPWLGTFPNTKNAVLGQDKCLTDLLPGRWWWLHSREAFSNSAVRKSLIFTPSSTNLRQDELSSNKTFLSCFNNVFFPRPLELSLTLSRATVYDVQICRFLGQIKNLNKLMAIPDHYSLELARSTYFRGKKIQHVWTGCWKVGFCGGGRDGTLL